MQEHRIHNSVKWRTLTSVQRIVLRSVISDIFVYLDGVTPTRKRTYDSLVRRGILTVGDGGYGERYSLSFKAEKHLEQCILAPIPLCTLYRKERLL